MGNIFYVLNIACTALSQRKAASVAAFEAQLSNCYWANQHSSHSIPDGTEHCCTEETFLLPPFLHRHCKKMANKHWMPFLSHCFSLVEGITANICKSTTLFIFLGETILVFLLWVQTVRKSLVFGFAHCANQSLIFYLVAFCLFSCIWLLILRVTVAYLCTAAKGKGGMLCVLLLGQNQCSKECWCQALRKQNYPKSTC